MTTIATAKRTRGVESRVSRARVFVLGAVLWMVSPSVGAVPIGPEFLVNTTSADSQSTSIGSTRARSVARNDNGDFVVVWQSAAQDGDRLGVFGQRYDPLGTPRGAEFPVSTTTLGEQRLPSVSMDNTGNFVVAWAGSGTGDADGVFARVFDASGVAQGAEIPVNQTTAGVQGDVDVAMDNGGDFVVVWSGNGSGDGDGVFARLFDFSGAAQTNEQLVNSSALGVQSRPAVAIDSNGDHVVAWDGPGVAGDLDVFFRRFDGGGNPQGGQIVANATTAEDQRNPAVALASNGNFIIVWESDDDNTTDTDFNVYAQRFASNGTANGSESRVNAPNTQAQVEAAVDLDASGDYIVAWVGDDDPSVAVDWNVHAQQFDKAGNGIDAPITVPTTTLGSQRAPSLALDDLENFAVIWQGNGSGDDAGVFGRIFAVTPSADLGVSITVDDATPQVGQQINVFVSLVNNGSFIATGIRVSNLLPPGLTFLADFATQGNYDSVSGFWDIASMAVSTTDVLRITARVDVGTDGSTLTNTATVIAVDQVDPAGSNDTFSVDIFPQLGTTSISVEPQSSTSLLPGAPDVSILRMRLASNAAVPETLRAITLTNATSGSGTQAQLDASWSTLTLRVDGGPALGTGSFTGGQLTFAGLDLALAPGDSLLIDMSAGAAIVARDGDVLDLRIDTPTDIELGGATQVAATWPLDPVGAFVVNGMSAAQIQVHDVPSANVFAGSTRNLGLDLTVPANGYEADVLEKLNVVNVGSASDQTELAALEAWSDDGDSRFDPQSDRLLGSLVQTGNRWELTALAEPVPLAGLRVFVSFDLSPNAAVGSTIRLGLGHDTDVALGMASSNDGPLDATVSNRFESSVSTSDRVTLNAGALPSGATRPGTPQIPLLHVVATNSYATDKRLVSLVISNATASANGGDTLQLDAELDMLRLHRDGNDDGVFSGASTDPVIATTFFSQGRAAFDAFAWDLEAGATRHLFVSGDVSLAAAADGDILAAKITETLDVAFDDPTATIADWPLDSGARWSVDGMIASQVQNHGAPGVTLGPGDGPVLAFDVTLPPNGYAADVLQGVTLRNAGNATAQDVADLRLWRDGGDGIFTPGGGDDTEIAPLVLVGSSWKSPQLNENLDESGLRLFAGVTVSETPSDSTSLRLSIPVGGLQTASGNDGPLDAAVVNPQPLLLSSAPLLATLTVLPNRSTIGQTLDVSMSVRNFGNEAVRSVVPSSLTIQGDASATLVAGPAPASFDLAPLAVTTFRWTYAATAPGRLQFSGNAAGIGENSILPRRSLHSLSNEHEVLLPADSLLVQPVGTMPFSVTRGETDVVPMSLTLTNPGGAATADVALTEVRLRVEDGSGSGLVPASVFSRVALTEGNITYVEQSSLPGSGFEVLLTLTTPVLVTTSEPVTVSLRCDVLSTTRETAFRVALLQDTWLAAEDAISRRPVSIRLHSGTFPLRSGTGEIRSAPTQLEVEAIPMATARASYGQTDVPLLGLELRNPGVQDLTSDIVVSAFELSVMDASDQPLADPSRFFERVRVKSGAQIFEEQTLVSTQENTLRLALALPLTVPVNSATGLSILGDVADAAPVGDVYLRVNDPNLLVARDASTNLPVPVLYTNAPLNGGTIRLEAPATSLRVQGTPSLPATLSVGSSGVVALVADLRHPDAPGVGRVRVQSLRLACRDEARRALAPDTYIDQLRVLRGAQELAAVTQIPDAGDIDVAIADLVLEPGETATLSLALDFETTAPSSFFEVAVSLLSAVDENLSTAVAVTPEDGAELPLVSGLTQLASPATELLVGLESRIPAVLVGDGSRVPMARLALTNTATGSAGAIQVDRLVLRGADRNRLETAVGIAASRALVFQAGALWGVSDSLTSDSLTASVQSAQPLYVAAGETIYLDVFATLQARATVNGFRMGVLSDDIVVRQPTSSLFTIRVQAEPGTAFPLWTDAGSFSTASLAESFANFPNPFAAGRQSTRFAFYLAETASVSLRILTPRGEVVSTLMQGASHGVGMHQTLTWRGRNDRDRVVTNGVYVAELVVVYAGGRTERVLHKVAVVR